MLLYFLLLNDEFFLRIKSWFLDLSMQLGERFFEVARDSYLFSIFGAVWSNVWLFKFALILIPICLPSSALRFQPKMRLNIRIKLGFWLITKLTFPDLIQISRHKIGVFWVLTQNQGKASTLLGKLKSSLRLDQNKIWCNY